MNSITIMRIPLKRDLSVMETPLKFITMTHF